MPERTRIPKANSVPPPGKQKEQSRTSQEQHGEQGKAAHVPETTKNVSERRTRSISQGPMDPTEEAMDIAVGGEGKPWVERKKGA